TPDAVTAAPTSRSARSPAASDALPRAHAAITTCSARSPTCACGLPAVSRRRDQGCVNPGSATVPRAPIGRTSTMSLLCNHSATRSLGARARHLLLALLLAVPLAAAAQAPPPAELEGIEAFVEQGMRDWGIPGLSVSVVKDDRLVWARGFGVRRLGHPEPVDADTLFNIASVSKAFDAAALGLLVDEGRIGWDDPVVDHIPGLQLYDPYVTRAAS